MTGIAFSGNLYFVALTSSDKYLSIYELRTFEQTHKLLAHSAGILAVAISECSKFIATSSEDNQLIIMSTEDFLPLNKISLPENA